MNAFDSLATRRALFRASSLDLTRQPELVRYRGIALVARIFVHASALPLHPGPSGVRGGVGRRIVHRELVLQRVGVNSSKALDDAQRVRRALRPRAARVLRTKTGRLDDERR